MNIRQMRWCTNIVWLSLITASFWWNYSSAQLAQKELALSTARSFFDYIVITRQWNASHGGVYAPITETNRPNPYLDTPLRDIIVSDTLQLTQINPAYMTRQLSEIADKKEGIKFRITSQKPIRPQNKPTTREKEYLIEFEQGKKEASLFTKNADEESLFYMAPLTAEAPCLSCHAKQGYKEGEVRGGISITMPFVMNASFFSLAFAHIGIGLIGLVGIFFTSRKLNSAYRELKNQAVFDSLTEIPNRRYFSEIILRECKLSRRLQHPLSVIMCDIDNFKAYNDTYGHTEGDQCLKRVAQHIHLSLDRPGDFCARYGGEEFVVILSNTSLAGAKHIAEKIRKTIENLQIPNENSSAQPIITLSLGIATACETDAITTDELINYADRALYRAKEKGKNRSESFSDVYCEQQPEIA